MENLVELFPQKLIRDRFCRRRRGIIRNEIAQVAVVLFTDRGFQRHGILRRLHDLTDLVRAHAEPFRNLVHGRFSAQLLQQLTGAARYPMNGLYHMDRNTDRSCLIRDGAGDRLTDPPGRIGGELEALGVVEFFHRLDQPEIALLNEIKEVHTLADILFRDADHETEVCLHQLILCRLVALRDPLGEVQLPIGIEQRDLADVLQVHPHRVVYGNALFRKEFVDILVVVHLCTAIHVAILIVAVVHVVVRDLDTAVFQDLIDLIDLSHIEAGILHCLQNIAVRQGAARLSFFDQPLHVHFLVVFHFSKIPCFILRMRVIILVFAPANPTIWASVAKTAMHRRFPKKALFSSIAHSRSDDRARNTVQGFLCSLFRWIISSREASALFSRALSRRDAAYVRKVFSSFPASSLRPASIFAARPISSGVKSSPM